MNNDSALTLPTCTADAVGNTVTIRANGEISPEDWSAAIALIGLTHQHRLGEDFDFDIAFETHDDVYTITKRSTRG